MLLTGFGPGKLSTRGVRTRLFWTSRFWQSMFPCHHLARHAEKKLRSQFHRLLLSCGPYLHHFSPRRLTAPSCKAAGAKRVIRHSAPSAWRGVGIGSQSMLVIMQHRSRLLERGFQSNAIPQGDGHFIHLGVMERPQPIACQRNANDGLGWQCTGPRPSIPTC
jgi:hypothetical protein